MYNVDKLAVYGDNSAGRDVERDDNTSLCGLISRFNNALYHRRLHLQCRRPLRARYVYIEVWGDARRASRMFSAVLCEVMVYH